MNTIKVNFLGNTPDPSRKKFFFFIKLFVVLVLGVGLFVAFAASNVVEDDSPFSQIPIVKRIRQLVRSADRSLDGQRDDRVNILLLGMGGAGHEGPYLTDTIILASVKPSTKQVALISIPRDLAVPIPGYGWYKVNQANAFGEVRERGSGGELVAKVLADVLDIPIQYYVRIDFDGFTKLIDDLGGIDVYVERAFVDSTYPTGENGNVTTIAFEAGWQHLNGGSALEFARSRHGSNGEGSDFARARRQQKILQAVKSRVLSLGTLRSPSKIASVLEALENNVKMNFTPWELLALARLAGTLDASAIIPEVLDDSPDGLLAPTIGVDGAYLLVPRNNEWYRVRSFVKNIFSVGVAEETFPEPVRVEIQNGTTIVGLAARAAEQVKAEGFAVVRVGNAETRDQARSVIYDLSGGKYPREAETLRTLLNAELAATAPPPAEAPAVTATRSASAAGSLADFLIIVGSQ